MIKVALILLLLGRLSVSRAEDGYRLWLRYDLILDTQPLLRKNSAIFCTRNSTNGYKFEISMD